MSSVRERVSRTTARLSVAGLTARVVEHRTRTVIEAVLPASMSAESWQLLLAALESCDSFGLVVSADGGRLAWAAIDKPPDRGTPARGQNRQL
ncbi:hypothetical protein AB0910_24420 [Streptomyces sp. NPDC047002]|uniref:hypothetical protein n=1 Tax=Streptomyces sp. NPDC047002 TaxID=3155475 RepID=UPI003454DCA5